VDGSQVTLSDLKGKVVLLNLWATWCPPCVRETPRLVRVYDKYRDQGFVILGINTTYQDDRAKVAQFVRDHNVSYPVLLDMNDEFGQKYGARLLPTSYLVDRTGKIVMTKVGEVDEAQLEEQVQALLDAERGTP
jgi:cytochrome c biogenesis protein CcmG/thiol:disulfide interchange protein DsbE